MKKLLLGVIIVALAAFVLLSAAMYFYQKKLVFYPIREHAVTPDQLEMAYEDVYIDLSSGERIHGWYLATQKAANPDGRPVVLFCHGNAGNISHRLETADLILDLGADILLFDYRGYGKSSGHPSEDNIYDDAGACFKWLTEEQGIPPERIILFGRSLGGAVAVELARRVPCGGVIVESSFTSAADMGKRMFPFFPIKLLVRYRFDSISKISEITCPVLVTHSPDDELVPFEMGRRLFAAANAPKRFVTLRGGHNEREYFLDSTYTEAIRDVIAGQAAARWR